jgi:hypothetical protein
MNIYMKNSLKISPNKSDLATEITLQEFKNQTLPKQAILDLPKNVKNVKKLLKINPSYQMCKRTPHLNDKKVNQEDFSEEKHGRNNSKQHNTIESIEETVPNRELPA